VIYRCKMAGIGIMHPRVKTFFACKFCDGLIEVKRVGEAVEKRLVNPIRGMYSPPMVDMGAPFDCPANRANPEDAMYKGEKLVESVE